MMNLIKKIKLNYSILKNILKLTDKKIKIVFYSENKFYQKFSYALIEFFAKKYPNEIYYISSDVDDKIENLEVNNLYIGDGMLMIFFFSIIKAKYFFLTLTDLDNHSIKKNKNVGKYIFYNHAGSSTFRGFTEGSFDNYDIILCNGQYQINEIRFREKQKNLLKKDLILTGYFYFDYILKKIDLNQVPDEILIAPTWSYKYKEFINKNFIEIIDLLIKRNFKVTFRPHPEHYKRSKNILKIIKDKFLTKSNFKFDKDHENIRSMGKAKCLITDFSDISLEYSLLFNRPVLYLDFNKIHNKDYSNFKDFEAVESKFKKEFGYTFFEKDIGKLDRLVNESIENFTSKVPHLKKFREEHYFNFGKTIEEFENIWDNKILET